MRTSRLALCLVLGSMSIPSYAFAHGGQFLGPVGGLPNGLRPPTDPTPPIPIDPNPGGTTPTDPAPGARPSTPTPSGPATPENPSTGEGPGARGKAPTLSLDNWTFWWAYNSADILRVKEHLYGLRGSAAGFFGVGEGPGTSNDATRATAKQVKANVIPALLAVINAASRQHPDTASAAYIALAKVTDDPSHIPLLVRGILEDDKQATSHHVIVREAAILSLGLLRRAAPARRFDAKELDAVREICFRVLGDPVFSTRIRSFAAFSLGLLADQPTRVNAVDSGREPIPFATLTRTPADRLFDLLRAEHANADLPSSLFLALSLQPATSITPEMREVTVEAALRGKLGKGTIDAVVQSYAALALGRIGTASEIGVLLNVLSVRPTPMLAKRSAAIALGRLAETVDGPTRAALAADLHRLSSAARDATTRNFGLMSLAHILSFEASAHRTDVIHAKGQRLVDAIFQVATDGSSIERPYGALALGLVARAIGEKPDAVEYGEIRLRAMSVLAAGFADRTIDPRSRGAFAIGLGLVGDASALGKLSAVVLERGADGELRGYCAVAIGLVGIPAPEALVAVRRALTERSSEELRLQCAVCLGLLGQSNAVDLLLKELAESDSQFVQGQMVLALGKIGDARAIPPLVAMVNDEARSDQTRAMACAGLGLVGDLEMLPSLSIPAKGINYRALVDPVAELLSIL